MLKNRGTEDHRLWLFDLAHGNLQELDIVRGFIKYYALNNFTPEHVVDDIVFRTHYSPEGAAESLRNALENYVA